MKISILILYVLAFLFNLTFAQEITQEEKQVIIANLDSSAFYLRYQSIKSILEYQIPEAINKVEENFWDQESELCIYFLRALKKYNSPLFADLAHSLIDSVDFIQAKYPPSDPLKIKVEITELLFEENDYSTTQYIFQLIERDKPKVNFESLYLLDKVVENVPEYETLAKDELIRASKQYNDKVNSSFALVKLVQLFGQESLQDLVDIFINHSDSAIRRYVLKYLQEYHYQDLNNLLKSRFVPDEKLTSDISYYLLKYFGQPSDVKSILDNLQFISDSLTYSSIKAYYDSYEPIPQQNYSTLLEYLDYSNSLCDTLRIYNWLGDFNFSNDLKNILAVAKANLQNGDSLACRAYVKSFQDSVDYVYADSLNPDPRFVTLEGWKFLYWNAQYILDRLPEIPVTEEINTYSVLAAHGVWLEQNSEILSGNIGVNEIGLSPFMDSDVELSIGISTTTPAGFSVKANRIKVKQSATVNANVYYNELDNNGTITGTLNTPLELPLFAALPEFHTSTPGTEDIVVPQNGEYTIAPGAYGDIQVKKNGKLTFTGGEYHINKLTAGDDNQFLFQSESEVRIKDKFDSGQGSYIGPRDTTTLSAEDIIFYVEGINGTNGNLGATPKAAKIGISNIVKANFYVPNGTLWIRQNSEVEGSFIGKDVDVGIGVNVKLNSAF
jgi:hypothetical protein